MQVIFGKEFLPRLPTNEREDIQREIQSRVYYQWYCQARGDFDILNYIDGCKSYCKENRDEENSG
jgi:hypothetical protein